MEFRLIATVSGFLHEASALASRSSRHSRPISA
jgi:hypothetical protein